MIVGRPEKREQEVILITYYCPPFSSELVDSSEQQFTTG
jgi:hypothetical protein